MGLRGRTNQRNDKVSQEELAKTQVLNLTDLQAVAKFERTTSKRPAVLFAIAGILSLSLGLSYTNIMTVVDTMPMSVSSVAVPKKVEPKFDDMNINTALRKNYNSILVCSFLAPEIADGTSGSAEYEFGFVDDELKEFSMTLEYKALDGKPNGKDAVEKHYNDYKEIEKSPVIGYTMKTTATSTSMKTQVNVDLAKYDQTTLSDAHKSDFFTNVYQHYGESKDKVSYELTSANFTCKEKN